MPNALAQSIEAGADYLDGVIDGPQYSPARAARGNGADGHSQPDNASAGDLARLFGPLSAVDLGDFLARSIPPREAILAPIILQQSLTMIHAWRGIGKTHVALGIGYAIACGGGFLGWRANRPFKVLYIDGEMPAAALQERLALIVAANDAEAPAGYFRIITPDLQEGAMPDLSTTVGQARIDAQIENDTALVIVDNLSALARSGSENEAESWLPVASWALRHRAAGRSILFIHHSGKGGAQRGTSKREDLLDAVIALRRPPDYVESDGAHFEVHFEKARGLVGDAVTPFEAKLGVDAHGRQQWTIRKVEDARLTRILDLKAEGLSMGQIASELGINKSTVSRALKKANGGGHG